MRKTTKLFITIYATLISLLLLATPFDLQLSLFLYENGSAGGFVMLISEMAYVPAYFIGVFSVFYYYQRTERAFIEIGKRYVLRMLTAIFILALLLMFVRSMRFLYMYLLFAPILFVLMSGFAWWVVKRVIKAHFFQFDFLASIGLLIIGIQYFLVTFLKKFIGRPRFYLVIEANELFTEWYQIQPGFASSRDFYAIPSGHTTFAALSLWFILVVLVIPQIRRYLPVVTITVTIWIFLQGYIRVYKGEHFLTDVLFSILITFFFIHVLYHITRYIRRYLKVTFNV